MSLFPHSLDAAPSAPGAPGAPISVKAYDINSDYVLVAWKPPNTVNEAPITGYFVDRLVYILKPFQVSFYRLEPESWREYYVAPNAKEISKTVIYCKQTAVIGRLIS